MGPASHRSQLPVSQPSFSLLPFRALSLCFLSSESRNKMTHIPRAANTSCCHPLSSPCPLQFRHRDPPWLEAA